MRDCRAGVGSRCAQRIPNIELRTSGGAAGPRLWRRVSQHIPISNSEKRFLISHHGCAASRQLPGPPWETIQKANSIKRSSRRQEFVFWMHFAQGWLRSRVRCLSMGMVPVM